MTEHNWKPGDVAMVTVRELAGSKQHVGLCYVGGRVSTGAAQDVARWTLADRTEAWSSVIDARPLVVIDPESMEDVARLADAFCHERWSHLPDSDECDPLTRSSMQAALREFAAPTPPRPDEPQGLGAVVEDVDGLLWTRVESGEAETRNPWYPANDADRQPDEYDHIKAVRVLSEGVVA